MPLREVELRVLLAGRPSVARRPAGIALPTGSADRSQPRPTPASTAGRARHDRWRHSTSIDRARSARAACRASADSGQVAHHHEMADTGAASAGIVSGVTPPVTKTGTLDRALARLT